MFFYWRIKDLDLDQDKDGRYKLNYLLKKCSKYTWFLYHLTYISVRSHNDNKKTPALKFRIPAF